MAETLLIDGRIVAIEHKGHDWVARKHSTLKIEIEDPYIHTVEVDIAWMPVVYPDNPGDKFLDRVADQTCVMIKARKGDGGRLEAARQDIFVRAAGCLS
jgi:hypothetical protein